MIKLTATLSNESGDCSKPFGLNFEVHLSNITLADEKYTKFLLLKVLTRYLDLKAYEYST